MTPIRPAPVQAPTMRESKRWQGSLPSGAVQTDWPRPEEGKVEMSRVFQFTVLEESEMRKMRNSSCWPP